MLISSTNILTDTPGHTAPSEQPVKLTHKINHPCAYSNLKSNFCCFCTAHLVYLPTFQGNQELEETQVFSEKGEALRKWERKRDGCGRRSFRKQWVPVGFLNLGYNGPWLCHKPSFCFLGRKIVPLPLADFWPPSPRQSYGTREMLEQLSQKNVGSDPDINPYVTLLVSLLTLWAVGKVARRGRDYVNSLLYE